MASFLSGQTLTDARLRRVETIATALQAVCAWAAKGLAILSGVGAPTAVQPSGSLYMRSDGTAGNQLYVSQGSGNWLPLGWTQGTATPPGLPVTLSSSPYSFTNSGPRPAYLLIQTPSGISSVSLNVGGNNYSQSSLTGPFIILPGAVLTITWATTAPTVSGFYL